MNLAGADALHYLGRFGFRDHGVTSYVYGSSGVARADQGIRTFGDLRGQTVGYLDFPNLVTALLQDRLPVYYYPFSGYWMDIGRHDDYGKAAEEFEAAKHKLGVSA